MMVPTRCLKLWLQFLTVAVMFHRDNAVGFVQAGPGDAMRPLMDTTTEPGALIVPDPYWRVQQAGNIKFLGYASILKGETFKLAVLKLKATRTDGGIEYEIKTESKEMTSSLHLVDFTTIVSFTQSPIAVDTEDTIGFIFMNRSPIPYELRNESCTLRNSLMVAEKVWDRTYLNSVRVYHDPNLPLNESCRDYSWSIDIEANVATLDPLDTWSSWDSSNNWNNWDSWNDWNSWNNWYDGSWGSSHRTSNLLPLYIVLPIAITIVVLVIVGVRMAKYKSRRPVPRQPQIGLRRYGAQVASTHPQPTMHPLTIVNQNGFQPQQPYPQGQFMPHPYGQPPHAYPTAQPNPFTMTGGSVPYPQPYPSGPKAAPPNHLPPFSHQPSSGPQTVPAYPPPNQAWGSSDADPPPPTYQDYLDTKDQSPKQISDPVDQQSGVPPPSEYKY